MGYSVGETLTWADLMIFEITSILLINIPDFTSSYPKINAVFELVNSHPRIVKWIKRRPLTSF